MKIQMKRSNRANYAQGNARRIRYLVIHYTGNNGDTAAGNATYFARESVGVSAHYFVDEGEVWQSVADSDVAWQCGTKGQYRHENCRNANSIGVEICMLGKTGNVRQGSIDTAIKLVRELMAKYGISSANVLRHYDVTGKNCPAPMVKDSGLWARFQAAISAPEEIEEDEDMVIYKTLSDVPDWALATVNKLMAKGLLKGEEGALELEHNMLRVLVINDRAGLYDR